MMKQAWIAALVAAALTASASANTRGIRYWPTTFTPQKLIEIPVVMDVGLWMDIGIQGDRIKLVPVSARRFEGCTDVTVRCNFNATLLDSISPTGVLPGNFSVPPDRVDIAVPGYTTKVCARLVDPDFGSTAGAYKNANVATITVRVMPQP